LYVASKTILSPFESVPYLTNDEFGLDTEHMSWFHIQRAPGAGSALPPPHAREVFSMVIRMAKYKDAVDTTDVENLLTYLSGLDFPDINARFDAALAVGNAIKALIMDGDGRELDDVYLSRILVATATWATVPMLLSSLNRPGVVENQALLSALFLFSAQFAVDIQIEIVESRELAVRMTAPGEGDVEVLTP
jgi:hypothetical protein